MAGAESKESFREKLMQAISQEDSRGLPIDMDFLEKYCRLTGHDFSLYRARDILPAGFFMIYTNPIVSRMFVSFFMKFPEVLKGFIHTSSRVEILKPLKMSGKGYTERLEVRSIEEKKGRKGEYFVVDLEIILEDEDNKKVASDVHQFFLKV